MFSAQEVFILRKENALLKTANTKLGISFTSQKQKTDYWEQEYKKLKKEHEQLEKELVKIKQQRDTYKGMIFKPNISTESKEDGQYQPPGVKVDKLLGGQRGHQGNSRKLPLLNIILKWTWL